MNPTASAVARVAEWLGGETPIAAVVLGSGAGDLSSAVERPRMLSWQEIPGFPGSTVPGHAGQLVAGTLAGKPVLLQSGRFHLYEGHAAAIAALPVRLFAELGIPLLILTNAAGGIRPGLRPPALMLLSDHLNLTWQNPLAGRLVPGEQRFPDMSEPYDRGLRMLARDCALAQGISLEEGVYAGVLGPSYETPAEIRMLRRLGADAVGMSTVPEVIVARARGMRVLALSTITNLAAGISPVRLSHDDVLAAGRETSGRLTRLAREVVRRLQE